MKTLLKITLSVLGVLVVVVIGLGIYVANIDLNNHKARIADEVRQATGRELVLGGPIEHTLYPWLGIEVSDVSMSNDPAFGDEPFLTAGLLEFRIKLLPLLSGEYEIDTVRLHDTVINLSTDAAGRGSWESLASGDSDDEPVGEDDGSFTLPHLVIGGIDISNLNLNYRDGQTGQVTSVRNLNFGTDALTFGDPLDMHMTGQVTVNDPQLQADLTLDSTLTYDLSGQAYTLSPVALQALLSGPDVPGGSASLTATTTVSVNLDEDTLSVPDLNLDLLDTTVSASFTGTDITREAILAGNLNVQGSDLSQVLDALGQQALARQVRDTGDRAVNIDTAFTFDSSAGQLSVPQLDASLLGATIRGTLEASELNSDAPSVSGELSAQGPDLPALLQLAGRFQGNDSALLSYGESLAAYPGSKRFSVETRFDANPAAGDVQLPVLSVNTMGLELNGNLDATGMDQASGSASGELSLKGSNLKPLVRALQQPELGEVIDSLSLDLVINGDRERLNLGPVDMTINFTGNDIPGGLTTLELDADGEISLEQETAVVHTFTLRGLGLNLQGNLQAENISSEPQVTGSLTLPAFDLRAFLAGINQPVPVTSDETTLKQVGVDTQFSFENDTLALSGLQAVLDDSTLSGSFSANTGDSGAVRFDLALDAINLDRYLAPPSEEATPAQSAEAELPLDTLRDLDVSGTVTVGEIVVSKLNMRDIAATIVANEGMIRLNPLRASLYEGSYNGDISLDVRTDTPAATVSTQLANINIGPLMTDYMGSSFVTGRGNIDLTLNGRGANTAAIRESLGGSGSIALEDGVLTGVDVGSVLRQVQIMIRERRMMTLDRGEQTPFDSFSSTLAINQGVVTTNDLLIASPGFRVSGRGTLVDLRSENIDFQMVAAVDESTVTTETEEYDIGGKSIPIACTGVVTSPRCLPDIQQLVRDALADEVRDRIGGFLQRALGGDRETGEEGTTAE